MAQTRYQNSKITHQKNNFDSDGNVRMVVCGSHVVRPPKMATDGGAGAPWDTNLEWEIIFGTVDPFMHLHKIAYQTWTLDFLLVLVILWPYSCIHGCTI